MSLKGINKIIIKALNVWLNLAIHKAFIITIKTPSYLLNINH